MRRALRSVILVASTVGVIVPLSAVSAGAAPEWFTCSKAAKVEGHFTGKFIDKACSVLSESGEGKWELVPGVGKGRGFKAKGGHSVLHLVIPGKGDIKIECASSKVTGGAIATPNRLSDVQITFAKCKSLGAPCNSAGGKKEEIVTMPLAGHLGYLTDEPGHPTVGVWLAPESGGAEGVQSEPECEGLYKARVHGALIGQITGDINAVSKITGLTWSVGPFLGEPKPGYTPLINQPSFENPEEGSGFLTEESLESGGETWEGQLPSGVELQVLGKGETLMIKA
jgi:hypothetical protein